MPNSRFKEYESGNRNLLGNNGVDYSGLGPKGHIRSDERIREDACEALFNNKWVDATDIEVSVDHGYITLKGVVVNRQQKKTAELCVEGILGVKDVMNYITLKKDRGLIGEMSIKANMI